MGGEAQSSAHKPLPLLFFLSIPEGNLLHNHPKPHARPQPERARLQPGHNKTHIADPTSLPKGQSEAAGAVLSEAERTKLPSFKPAQTS